MNYSGNSYIFIYSILIFFALQIEVLADDSDDYFMKNKKSCIASPALCINQINENIKHVKNHSGQWYRLNNLKLLAIWEIRDSSWLKKEIHKYVALHNAPPVFLTTVYTLHAKMLFHDGNVEQGTLYANKAVELIKQVNKVSFDSDRYAEVIILYNQLDQYENAIKFITWINTRMARMGPNHYFPKLQTAIAHTYIKVANYDLALIHYQFALTGFIEAKYLLETAEGYHNVARALQGKKNYSHAIPAFKKALKWMKSAVKVGDYSIEAKNYTQLRLIEVLQKNNQHAQAKLLLKDINPKEVNKSFIPLYQKLKTMCLVTKKRAIKETY